MSSSPSQRTQTVPLVLTALLIACGGGAAVNEAVSNDGASEPSTSDDVPAVSVTHEGIDVSHYQGDVDWAQVKAAGMTFGYVKATEGASEVDPMFSANWAATRQAGLVRGAYHFFDPEVDAATQAEHFIATVQLEGGDLPPVIDIEVTEGVSTEGIDRDVRTWLEKVAAAYGVQPIIYSDLAFIDDHLASGFDAYPLWVADYSRDAPRAPGNWSAWTFWQYSQSGDVAGVEGAVDRDRYQGTEAGWLGLLVPASP